MTGNWSCESGCFGVPDMHEIPRARGNDRVQVPLRLLLGWLPTLDCRSPMYTKLDDPETHLYFSVSRSVRDCALTKRGSRGRRDSPRFDSPSQAPPGACPSHAKVPLEIRRPGALQPSAWDLSRLRISHRSKTPQQVHWEGHLGLNIERKEKAVSLSLLIRGLKYLAHCVLVH